MKKRNGRAERKLTRKQVEARIMGAVAEAVSSSGLATPTEARKATRSLLKHPPRGGEWFPPMFAELLYESFERDLKRLKLRSCTEEQLKPILAKLRNLALEMIPMLRKGLHELRKKLPRRGGPGRRAILGQAQRVDACEQIATMLKTKKMSLPDIFEAVAEGFRAKGIQVAARTIKRTWENRTELYT